MKVNNYFINTGTANEIAKSMADNITYNKANADLLFCIIHNNKQLLSDNEYFIENTTVSLEDISGNVNDAIVLGLMFSNQKYHINIKYATLALLCLIFDVTISRGFATFLLAIFGIDYSLVKLEKMEKCIAYKLKEEKALSTEELKSLCQCNFVHYNSRCGKLNNDGTCNKWADDEMIDNTLETLEKKSN